MGPLFEITKTPPSQREIKARCKELFQLSVNALGAAYGIGFIAVGAAAVSLTTGDASDSAISLLVAGAAGVASVAAAVYRKHLLWQLSWLRPAPATPEDIDGIFLLTADTRQYAKELIRQGRSITTGELKLISIYAEELRALAKQLSEPDLIALGEKVGFDALWVMQADAAQGTPTPAPVV